MQYKKITEECFAGVQINQGVSDRITVVNE